MTIKEKKAAYAHYKTLLALQDAKGSTGSTGKWAEVMLRDYVNVKGLRSINDVRARNANRVDIQSKKWGNIEVKTGSGAVKYACNGETYTKDDLTEENILPDADLILWAPFSSFLSEDNLVDMTWVFTRASFIACLEAIGKNGLASSLKVSKGGLQINIQTITPRMEDRLWDYLETCETVKEFFGRG